MNGYGFVTGATQRGGGLPAQSYQLICILLTFLETTNFIKLFFQIIYFLTKWPIIITLTIHRKKRSMVLIYLCTRCPEKHGNSVTNSISSLLWISIVIPNFKSHNIIMSARVYFMKRVKDCKDMSIMWQWRRTSLLCLYTAIFLFY